MMNAIILENITVQVKLMKDAIDNGEILKENDNMMKISENFISFFSMFESEIRTKIANLTGSFDLQGDLKELELIDLGVDEIKRMISMNEYNISAISRIIQEARYIFD